MGFPPVGIYSKALFMTALGGVADIMVKVAFMQTAPVFGSIQTNVDYVVKRLSGRPFDGVSLVVLPELFSTGYQFRSRKELSGLAEPLSESIAVDALCTVARRRKMHIVFGMAEREGRRLYNSSVLVGPRGVVGLYRKAHLFWAEKRLFDGGNTPLKVYRVGPLRVGMMICFDWIFPEVARVLALEGADIICQPSNLVLPYCPSAMVTRSIENRLFSITANRVGTEERVKGRPLRFIGLSQIVSPDGSVLKRASSVRPQIGIAQIEPGKARNKWITPANHLFRDRRPQLYRRVAKP